MADDIAWDLYRTFLGVLTEGSLSGAARALGITQPTAGRHIAALEKSLGVALFTRAQTGLLPTEAALALRGHAEDMRSTAAALRRAAGSHGEGVRGTVRISASEIVGVEVLPAILAGLREAHLELKIELVVTNRVQDLLRQEADIGVRMTRPRQEALVARRIGDIPVGLHAHPDYLARHGTPKTLDDLSRHTLVGFDQETAFIRAARKQLALVRAGCGIGMCQVPLARREPRLVRLLPRQFTFRLETWVTMHEDLRGSPRCRAAFDALAQGLRRYIAGG
ncbi:MAG: LysR family transcriptional regulator [Burkholderiales bacterium]|nr:LysR family transcriptional regulator [Burkholderiales bacterium]